MRITIATLKKVARPHGIEVRADSGYDGGNYGLIEIIAPVGKCFDDGLHALCSPFDFGGRTDAIVSAIDDVKGYTPLKACPSDCDCLQPEAGGDA